MRFSTHSEPPSDFWPTPPFNLNHCAPRWGNSVQFRSEGWGLLSNPRCNCEIERVGTGAESGMDWRRFVLSQMRKCEAPGAPG